VLDDHLRRSDAGRPARFRVSQERACPRGDAACRSDPGAVRSGRRHAASGGHRGAERHRLSGARARGSVRRQLRRRAALRGPISRDTSVLGRYSIVASGADPRLLDGTGLAANGSLGFIAGGEVDGVYPSTEWWGPLGGAYDRRFEVAANLVSRDPSTIYTAEAIWRELPSGGRVFASGTFYWGWALDPAFAASHVVSPGLGRVTLNILAWLATAR
jgi:hypothetical protein